MFTAQRWLRARFQRRRYLWMMSSFRHLQLLARDWLSHRYTAAVVIQSVVRMWSARKHLANMHHSALLIQVSSPLILNTAALK